jgi:hypothetical protein
MAITINAPLTEIVEQVFAPLDHLERGGLEHLDLEGHSEIDYRFDPVLTDELDPFRPTLREPKLAPTLHVISDYIPF